MVTIFSKCCLHLALFLPILSSCQGQRLPNHSGENNPTGFYQKGTVQYKQLSGVAPNLLSLDVYYSGKNGASKPVVVWVHGGAWSLGDKTNQLENKKSLFVSLGYILVSVNYRLSPKIYRQNPNRVKYPTHNEDVADAIKWVYSNIHQYGGNRNKIVLMGHSAGAHLVALSGTSSIFLPKRGIPITAIKGVACIDTEGYDVEEQAGAGTRFYLNAFGEDSKVWKQASPINHIFPGMDYPPFFIAKRGETARIAMADEFIRKLKANGVSVSEVNGSAYSHAGINEAIGKPGETLITNPLKAFLSECFR